MALGIRDKIDERLVKLEVALKEGKHLGDEGDQEAVSVLMLSVSKFYSVLSEEDRDFLMSARVAVSQRLPWA